MKRSLTPLLLAVAFLAPSVSFAQEDDLFPDAEAPPEGGEPAAPEGEVDPDAPSGEDDFDFAPEEQPPAEEVAPPQEEVDDLPPATKDKGSTRWGRVSASGLSGFGQMITTDKLPEFGIRASFGLETQFTQILDKRFSGSGRLNAEANAQVYSLGVAVGLMEMIEISLRIPFVDWEVVLHNDGGNAPDSAKEDSFGLGNPEIAVKFLVPLDIEIIKLGAFLRAQPGLGGHRIYTPRRFPMEEGEVGEYEIGAIVAADLDVATIYANLAFRDFEDDSDYATSSSFRWRLGATFDAVEMLSVGLYWDFEEFEGGSVGMNGYLGMNVDVFVNEMIVVSGGFEYLVIGTAMDDLTTRGSDDEVTYFSFNLGISVLF